MLQRSLIVGFAIAANFATASECPSGDTLLQNNTPLANLCPNGFGQFHPGSIAQAMQNQPQNVSMITAAAEQNGVPVDLALAVSYHESEGFNSCAGSQTGVKGPMQLTQATAGGLGFNRDINDQNIQGGMAVLGQAVKACGSTNYSCLAARYNGSNAAEQAGWARGVAAADTQLQNNPNLVASACSGDCSIDNVGDFPNSPSPDETTSNLTA
ncbi:Transglycosylase SLT domain-containing protein [Rhizobiales bacterium GAS188]|nr:Transglycosylase SLT domain-containing protein [Rhizobiales bacterium GAS188]